MFDRASRYAAIPTSTLSAPDADGQPRLICYVGRRFLPSPTGSTTLVEHTVTQGERLDVLTAQYAGDPTLFWRICDSNLVLRPDELEATGAIVVIALPPLGG